MSRCGDVAIRNYPRWRSVFVLENQLGVYCSGIFFNIRLLQTRSLQGSIRTIIRTRHHPNMHKLSCWLLSLYGTAEGYEMKASLLVADVKRRAVSCYSLVTLLWGKQDVKRAVTLSVCAWRHAAIRFHLTSRASMRRWLFDLRLLWWLWELCSGDSSLTSRLIWLNRPGYSPNSRHRTDGGINHTRTGLAIVPLCARKKYI